MLIYVCTGCTNSRVVQPLNKNQWQVAASVGGPVIKQDDLVQPIPLSSVSVAYGLDQNLSVFSGIDPSLSSVGVYHMDMGFSHEILTPFNMQPGITYSSSLNTFWGQENSEFKIYPQIDINAYWLLPFRNDYFYIGVSNWFELASERALKQKQNTRWIPSLHAGYTLQYDKYGFTLEMKYLAIQTNNQNLLVDYYSPTNNGSLGAYLSMSRKF